MDEAGPTQICKEFVKYNYLNKKVNNNNVKVKCLPMFET